MTNGVATRSRTATTRIRSNTCRILWQAIRSAGSQSRALAVTDAIEGLGGAKPKSFDEFVRETQGALTAEPHAMRA